MADLAEPLKQDCNISLPLDSLYQDVPTARASVYVCVRTCVFVNLVVSLATGRPRQYTTTLLSLSLCYSVQMSDGVCVHIAWKTHFQRRKSGF